MSPALRKQIEEIADTTPGNTARVIVQMEPPADVTRFILKTAEAVAKQRQVISARALVPPPARLFAPPAGGVPSLGRLLKSSPGNARTFLATRFLEKMERTRVTEVGTAALAPLLAVPAVREGEPHPLPIAGSAAVTLSKKELTALPAAVREVVAVFPNRFVPVPSVARAAEPPPAVTDNRGHAWGVGRTGALACWGAYGARGGGVKVAVLDTGYDNTHPDLAGKLAGFAEFDRQGRVVAGTDAVAAAYDDGTHGSHVAGTIVGGNAGGRWIGMAPDARILAGLVLKGGGGTTEQILAGIEWAVRNEADVINLSLGGLDMSPDVIDTYTLAFLNASRAGIAVVAAVGNEGQGTSGAPGNDLYAFTVGATDVDDRAAGFSGGRTQIIRQSKYIAPEYLPLPFSKPEVTAPGVDVLSVVPGGKYDVYSGSSMAAPHVSGAMALLLSTPPPARGSPPATLRDLTGRPRVDVLQQLLTSSVKELGEAGQDHRYGYGRIDVLRAYGFAVDLGYIG